MRNLPIILALALFATSSLAAAEKPSVQRQGELVNLVRQDCGSCHGLTMKGGLGSSLLPKDLEGKDSETLVEIVLDGLHETPMPPWRAQFAEGEAEWIIEQLKKGLPE